MRPIKFRGFACDRDDERRWIFGQLNFEEINLGNFERPVIVYYDNDIGWYSNHVHEESVGQFTGAEDGEGNEVYEGDIIRDGHGRVYEVEWDEDEYQFVLRTSEGIIRYTLGGFVNDFNSFKVIGNKFENKELMEGGEG